MSQSDIDDSDRDPRRVRDRPGDPLFIPELPLKSPAVKDAIRFRMPYNYKSKSKTVFDETDQSVGDTFVSHKSGQVKSATFSRRDDPTGSTVTESLQDRRLRMNSYSHMLRGEGRRHSVQFRDWGYNRDMQRRRQNVDIQEQSRSRFNPSYKPQFPPPKSFSNHLPRPRSNFTRPRFDFTQNRNWIPNKKLSNQLTNHHITWKLPTETVSGEFGDYLTIRRSPPTLRDDKYREMADKQHVYPQTRERHLHTKRSVYSPPGLPRPDVALPFRPDLWYDWSCQKNDGKLKNDKFNFSIRCRPTSPRKQNWLSGLSIPVSPRINVTGWRKRVTEVGFQIDIH